MASGCRARREWPALPLLGVLLLGFGNGAVVWAEQTVPSGLTAVLVATSPFWMVGIDALMSDGERLTLRRSARTDRRLQRHRHAGLAGDSVGEAAARSSAA